MLDAVVRELNGEGPVLKLCDREEELVQVEGRVRVPCESCEPVLLVARGLLCETMEEAEESACYQLIRVAQRQFGVIIDDMNLAAAWAKRREKERYRGLATCFRDGWNRTLDDMQFLEGGLEAICDEAIVEPVHAGVMCIGFSMSAEIDICVKEGLAQKAKLERSMG